MKRLREGCVRRNLKLEGRTKNVAGLRQVSDELDVIDLAILVFNRKIIGNINRSLQMFQFHVVKMLSAFESFFGQREFF